MNLSAEEAIASIKKNVYTLEQGSTIDLLRQGSVINISPDRLLPRLEAADLVRSSLDNHHKVRHSIMKSPSPPRFK